MTYQRTIKEKLENFPSFRERRFRAQGLFILTLRHCGYENKYREGVQLTMEEMIDFAKIYDNLRHEWDAVLNKEENKHLRGRDWNDGKIYSQLAQKEFGYEPGFNQINRELAKIG